MGPRNLLGRTAATLLASWAVACSADDQPPDPGPGPCWPGPDADPELGEAELGGGVETSEAFAPFARDQEVDLIHGPQGGHHIWVRPRLRGLVRDEQGRIDTLLSAFLDGDDAVDLFECPHHPVYAVDPDSPDHLLAPSIPLIIQETRVPDVVGNQVLLRLEALDPQGRYARDERTVIPHNAE